MTADPNGRRPSGAPDESEARFRALFEQAGVGVAEIETPTGRFLEVNRKYCEMMGYSRDEFLALDFVKITHPEDLAGDLALMERLKRGEISEFSMEKRLFRKSGEIAWVHLAVTPMWAPGAVPDRHVAIVQDITRRRETEEALQRSEARYRTLFENFPLGVSLADAEGKLVAANRESERLLGLSVDAHAKRRVDGPEWRIIRPDGSPFPPEEYASVRALRERRKIENVEMGIVKGEGLITWISVTATPNPEPEGGVTIAYVDITARKQAEEKWRVVSDRLSLATRAGGIGVWDFDVVHDRLVWDDQMYRLYGITEEQFAGAYEAWQAGLHPDDRSRAEAEAQMALRGEKEFDTEFRVLWPGGEVHALRALAVVQRDEYGSPVRMIGTNWDITDRKQAEVNALLLEQRVARAERIAAISKLGGGVAHEMNNVLAGILMTVQRGLIEIEDGATSVDSLPNLREILECVESYCLRGARIVSAIRSLSVPENNRVPGSMHVGRLVERLLELREAEHRARAICVETRIEADAWALADSGEIDQLLTNLVINAEHAMIPTGGGVLRVVVSRIDGQVEIRVEDSGVGMTEEVLKQAFLPFFSTKGAYAKDDYKIPGTGLGLAICARIVEANGGTIQARSAPGEGSVFVVRLPEAVPGEQNVGLPVPAPRDPAHRLHVLVVDDEEEMAKSLRDFIARWHPDTHHVTSARAALEYVARRRPDLILTDYIMPDMRADAMLKELPPGIPVVAITGWIDFKDDEERQRILGGFHRVLQKPYDLKAIRGLLAEVSDRLR